MKFEAAARQSGQVLSCPPWRPSGFAPLPARLSLSSRHLPRRHSFTLRPRGWRSAPGLAWRGSSWRVDELANTRPGEYPLTAVGAPVQEQLAVALDRIGVGNQEAVAAVELDQERAERVAPGQARRARSRSSAVMR